MGQFRGGLSHRMNYCTLYPIVRRRLGLLSLVIGAFRFVYLAVEHLLGEVIGMIRRVTPPIVNRSHRALHPDATGHRPGKNHTNQTLNILHLP